MVTKIVCLKLVIAQSDQIVRYRFFFVEADLAGVSAFETLVEDAAGELVEVFVFESAQHAGINFGNFGDGLKRDAALLALFAKFFAERAHDRLRWAELAFRPHRQCY